MKKVISIIGCVVLLITILMSLSACGAPIQEEWPTILLGEHLPTPQKGQLRSGSNLDNIFMGGIENVGVDYYTEYKNACIEMGYTIEPKESGTGYDAFNGDGYELSLSYYSNQIHITLHAPLILSEIEWPTTGIGSRLPAPSSTLGKVTSDSSNSFCVTIGNTSIEDYNAYIKACEESGFVVDYTKSDSRYEAKDGDGYRLYVQYIGYNQIEVTIQTPKQESNATPMQTTAPTEDTAGSNDTAEGLSKEFKDAMDSYEQFMDEYVAFMKKYLENPSDLSLLVDYTDYMSKYADFVEDFEKWETEDMNTAETAYYIEVQARVSKKLLEVTQ